MKQTANLINFYTTIYFCTWDLDILSSYRLSYMLFDSNVLMLLGSSSQHANHGYANSVVIVHSSCGTMWISSLIVNIGTLPNKSLGLGLCLGRRRWVDSSPIEYLQLFNCFQQVHTASWMFYYKVAKNDWYPDMVMSVVVTRICRSDSWQVSTQVAPAFMERPLRSYQGLDSHLLLVYRLSSRWWSLESFSVEAVSTDTTGDWR
jgi:hypothetical protein